MADHFANLYVTEAEASFSDEVSLGQRMEAGWDGDLRDPLEGVDGGFRHAAISSAFAKRLRDVFVRDVRSPGTRLDRHVWAADHDRRLQSLFPTRVAGLGSDDVGTHSAGGRTRASAVLQQALLRSRRVLKGNRVARNHPYETARAFCPSPYHVAMRMLCDPDAPATEVYACAAIRSVLADRVTSGDRGLRLDYDTVSRALDTIRSRAAASKPSRRPQLATFPEVMFLQHYLAAQGMLILEIEWRSASSARIDELLLRPDALFDPALESNRTGKVGFRLHPEYSDIPEAGVLLNEIEGLPLPIEGMSEIFQGGLRFASGGDVVAAISGPFGAGKTSACLALAASLAPLGCRTLFLTCEEDPEDIEARLVEAAPRYLGRYSSLFPSVRGFKVGATGSDRWFRAHKLRVPDTEQHVDVAAALTSMIDETLRDASLFAPFNSQSPDAHGLPPFARPVVVVDGFHRLFLESSTSGHQMEGSLRRLIDLCRRLRAVFLFTVADHEPAMKSLDYLCDIVFQLDRRGFDMPESRNERIFRLLKARRQPSLPGAHILHLSGSRSFRIKPNVSSYAHRGKLKRWWEPDPDWVFRLSEAWDNVRLQVGSQSLIYGFGSSGKAGLGLYMLNRRPIPAPKAALPERDLFAPDVPALAGALEWRGSYESRVLIVSFLYHAPYYRQLARRVRRQPQRSGQTGMAADSLQIEVLALYPGNLTPEDLLAKIDRRLWAAEARGLPFTGVLVDGIHNVYVQFPALQDDTTFWPQLYGEFRRRGLNVVTTHTDFELKGAGPANHPSIDFEHARRRAAPLMSALVSAADYTFELSATVPTSQAQWEYRFQARNTLGLEPPTGFAVWDRQACRLGDWQVMATV